MISLDEILQKVTGNQILGVTVEVMSTSGDDFIFHATHLRKRRGIVDVLGTYDNLKSFEDLFKLTTDQMPVALSINGKSLIHKKVTNIEGVSPIQQILPNAKQSDFYVQEYVIDESDKIISLIRKGMLEEVISLFIEKGFFISAVILGPFSIDFPGRALTPDIQAIIANGCSVDIKDDKIHSVQVTDNIDNIENYQIDRDLITSENIDSFFLAFNSLTSYYPDLAYPEGLPPINKEDYYYKKGFKVFGWGILILFLFILLGNFMLFNSFSEKERNLQDKLSFSHHLINELDSLSNDLQTRKSLMESSGFSKNSMFSYYADRLASCIPDNLILTRMVINPAEKKIRAGEEIAFKVNEISIEGQARTSIQINDWVRSLKEFDWIKEIAIVKYKYVPDQNTGDFEIIITIKLN